MDMLVIEGGHTLKGEIPVSGSKNAALPIMSATLLSKGKYVIHNIPKLKDVYTMAHLLRIIGAIVEFENHTMIIDTRNVNFFEAPYELVKTMRASIYVLGPLTARYGKARVSLPGGCAWGPRPVNFHVDGMKKLGAHVELSKGYIVTETKKLKGTDIYFDIPSVGATCNLMMAASLADGITKIENAAREPEVVALGQFLQKMGAKISGLGTSEIIIEGVDELFPADFHVIPDRIEAATFLVAGAMTGGKITVTQCEPAHFQDVLDKLKMANVSVNVSEKEVSVQSNGIIQPVDIVTAVYPGFPTDMQAQWTSLMLLANGSSVVTDEIYFDRFAHVPELNRLGANIIVKNNSAFIKGHSELIGADVMSTDLRGSASLVLAGLVASGETRVHRVYHIDRGYENIEKKLQKVGAVIRREDDGQFY
jgi:UDP-N-acetylglucosamine 1-carboxyvinyltransferase